MLDSIISVNTAGIYKIRNFLLIVTTKKEEKLVGVTKHFRCKKETYFHLKLKQFHGDYVSEQGVHRRKKVK